MPAIEKIDPCLRLAKWLAATLSVVAIPSALAQSISCTGTSPVCAIPAGNFSSSLSHIDTSQSALSITNAGTFNIAQPGNQALGDYLLLLGSIGNNAGSASANANAPAGANGGPTTVVNSGAITQSVASAQTAWIYALLGTSAGGNGGPQNDASRNGGAGGI